MLETDAYDDETLEGEDRFAGKMLAVLLSVFFLYTIFTGAYVLWWTWDGIRTSMFQ